MVVYQIKVKYFPPPPGPPPATWAPQWPQGPPASTVNRWVEVQGRQIENASEGEDSLDQLLQDGAGAAGAWIGKCCQQQPISNTFTAQSPEQVTAGHFQNV